MPNLQMLEAAKRFPAIFLSSLNDFDCYTDPLYKIVMDYEYSRVLTRCAYRKYNIYKKPGTEIKNRMIDEGLNVSNECLRLIALTEMIIKREDEKQKLLSKYIVTDEQVDFQTKLERMAVDMWVALLKKNRFFCRK